MGAPAPALFEAIVLFVVVALLLPELT